MKKTVSGNYIVVPPYYNGTSFEDIVTSLKDAAVKTAFNITFIEPTEKRSYQKNINFFDDAASIKEYTTIIEKLLDVENARHILFIDFFAPGIDIFKYKLETENHQVNLGALLHGGTFVPGDLYSWKWLEKAEEVWFELFNKVYAPSSFLQTLVPEKHRHKVAVSPWGLDSMKFNDDDNKNIEVIFPHRLEDDKGIKDLITIIQELPTIHFTITSPKPLSGNPYYERIKEFQNVNILICENNNSFMEYLSKSKVVLSCANQENFGYSIVKAIRNGCIPILPNRLVYPEFYPDLFLYKDITQAKEMIIKVLNDKLYYRKYKEEAEKVKGKLIHFSFLDILNDFFTV